MVFIVPDHVKGISNQLSISKNAHVYLLSKWCRFFFLRKKLAKFSLSKKKKKLNSYHFIYLTFLVKL